MKRTRLPTSDMNTRKDDGLTDERAADSDGEDGFSDALSNALSSVESIIPEEPPAMQYFEMLVQDTKRQAAHKLRKDVSIFAGIAAFIGAGWVFSATLNAFADVLAITSGLSLLSAPLAYGMYRRREGFRREGQGS